MKQHIPKLEKWQKFDKIAKIIIQWSLSVNMIRRFLSNENNRKLSAKELHNSIRAHFRKVFLFDKLLNSRYDGISGLGNHVKSLFDMAYELKALGLDVSDEFMCVNFASYQIDDKYKNDFERQLHNAIRLIIPNNSKNKLVTVEEEDVPYASAIINFKNA
ncbi:unnamed protein product [Miscanthus lutarioriparius]|uniref:Uncharacterized protein n=1 Tax=Miscanthus lutarioriparius TaxID=422564 RepID=A0A811MTH4_9POAL|nr:unnamed protein product [Miscanthus lutarioriparius]